MKKFHNTAISRTYGGVAGKSGYGILFLVEKLKELLKITIYTCGQKQGIKIMKEDINKLKNEPSNFFLFL